MALTSTMHRFAIEVSDVDRSVYETLELHIARHPSETIGFLLTRVLAYVLEHHEDLQFGRGIGDPDDPALWQRDPTGRIQRWIDIGAPSADRLHKASKRADEVLVYTHRDPEILLADWAGARIHNSDQLTLWAVPESLLTPLADALDRKNAWGVLRTEGTVYVTVGDDTFEGAVTEHRLPA